MLNEFLLMFQESVEKTQTNKREVKKNILHIIMPMDFCLDDAWPSTPGSHEVMSILQHGLQFYLLYSFGKHLYNSERGALGYNLKMPCMITLIIFFIIILNRLITWILSLDNYNFTANYCFYDMFFTFCLPGIWYTFIYIFLYQK